MDMVQGADSTEEETLSTEKKIVMAFQQVPSLIKMLMLILAVINLAHGEPKEEKPEDISDNCPTQENTKFPKSVMVDIHVGQDESASSISTNIRNRSLSPWDYRINEDPNRFPHVILEANCRHHFCVKPRIQELDHELNSVPIQQEILVLKRKQNGCRQSYQLEKKLVTVGCTCVTYNKHGPRKRNGLTYRRK